MRVIQDDLWLCTDCLIAAVNDDYIGLDYYYDKEDSTKREKVIRAGLTKLGPGLVWDANSETGEGIEEFSSRHCDCCGTHVAGQRERFIILGE